MIYIAPVTSERLGMIWYPKFDMASWFKKAYANQVLFVLVRKDGTINKRNVFYREEEIQKKDLSSYKIILLKHKETSS